MKEIRVIRWSPVLIGIVASGMIVSSAADSAAASVYWLRRPGAACAPVLPTYNNSVSWYYGPSLASDAPGVWAELQYTTSSFICPFDDSNTTPDKEVTDITVDLVDNEGAGVVANAVMAKACVFGNWTDTCGSPAYSAGISAGGHTGLDMASVLSAWQNDSNPGGYAYVYVTITPGSDDSPVIAGLYIR